MRERLTDSELATLYGSSGDDCCMALVKDAVDELRELRHLRSHPPLSADERGQVAWLIQMLGEESFDSDQWKPPIAVLSRLLAASETQGEK
mgnify:CR=1 FL=1